MPIVASDFRDAMPTAAIKTLGCKLNQYESEQMREQLLRLGYCMVDFESSADLYLINSCTVTSNSDRDTRRLARHARKLNPSSFVVVTGCYAEVAAAELRAIPEIDLVCGMADKLRLAELVPHPETPAHTPAHNPNLIAEFAGHTRCFVKVQEGCNARCSYCIIPEARGPSRSVPVAEVLEQGRRLGQAAHPELVLIGTHLGQYGNDLTEEIDLAELIVRLAALPEIQRLRLSSIEPCEVTGKLIELVTGGGRTRTGAPEPAAKLCRYLHIPLQSGSDSVLRRMNRPYDSALYHNLLSRIHAAQPLTGLGADVIVGFPGETAEEFEQTRALMEALPLSYLHVFTYSPRKGTPAAEMPDQVLHEVKMRRNHLLRGVSETKREAFAASMVGQILETVLQTEEDNGWLRGVTDNYLQLRVQADRTMLGRLVACQVTGQEGAVLVGQLI